VSQSSGGTNHRRLQSKQCTGGGGTSYIAIAIAIACVMRHALGAVPALTSQYYTCPYTSVVGKKSSSRSSTQWPNDLDFESILSTTSNGCHTKAYTVVDSLSTVRPPEALTVMSMAIKTGSQLCMYMYLLPHSS
jgi:hypothetical protein